MQAGKAYSMPVAAVLLFNLVTGFGALAIPRAFHAAGLVLGLLGLAGIAVLSFISTTWLVEAMGAANRLSGQMEIASRFELSQLVGTFLGKFWNVFFNFTFIVYLAGDLAIYGAATASALASFTGPFLIFEGPSLYCVHLGLFGLLVVPLSLGDFQSTKKAQYLTMAARFIALGSMMVYGLVISFERGKNSASLEELRLFDGDKFPEFFGVAVYCFMCHHSLPSILTPMKNKKHIFGLLLFVYCIFLAVYVTLSVSAALAFGKSPYQSCDPHAAHSCQLADLYILNFNTANSRILANYLLLFPVAICLTNFPLIAITTRNNLHLLLCRFSNTRPELMTKRRRITLSLFVTIVPLIVASIFRSVSSIVSFTGAYAGLVIQFLIPALLMGAIRKAEETVSSDVELVGLLKKKAPETAPVEEETAPVEEEEEEKERELRVPHLNPASKPNRNRSPFRGTFWISLAYVFTAVSFVLVVLSQASQP